MSVFFPYFLPIYYKLLSLPILNKIVSWFQRVCLFSGGERFENERLLIYDTIESIAVSIELFIFFLFCCSIAFSFSVLGRRGSVIVAYVKQLKEVKKKANLISFIRDLLLLLKTQLLEKLQHEQDQWKLTDNNLSRFFRVCSWALSLCCFVYLMTALHGRFTISHQSFNASQSA